MRGNYYGNEKRHDIIIFQTRAGLQSTSFSQSCAGLTNHIRVLNHTGSTSIITQQQHNPLQIVIMSPREKLGSFSVVRLKPDQENLQPLIFVQVKEVLELCSRVFLLQIYIHLRVGALWVKLVKYCVCICVCVCNRLFLMSLLSAGYCVSMFGSSEARRTVNAFPCFCCCCCCKKPNRVKKGSNLGHNCSA